MSTMQFLDAVLPQQGKRFVVAKKINGPVIPCRLDTNQQVIRTGQQYDAQDFDVYFAVGGYNVASTPKGGPSREAQHAQYHRCLRIDIDVNKPGENDPDKYDTKRNALVALNDFITALSLPSPAVVDSGGGYHVYWPFDRDLMQADWLPLAARLKDVCAGRIKVDPTTTSDAARILRLPGTHNQKPYLNGADVKLLTQWVVSDPTVLTALLNAVPLLGMTNSTPAQPRAPQMASNVSPLSANVGGPPPYRIQDVVQECDVLRDMYATGGAGWNYMPWFYMLGTVHSSMNTPAEKFAAARNMSCGWDDGRGKAFNVADFTNKFNSTANNTHPFSCSAMQTVSGKAAAICQKCPYFADNLPSVGRLGYNGFQSKRTTAVQPQQQQAQAAFNPQTAANGPFTLQAGGRITINDAKFPHSHFLIASSRPSMEKGPNGKHFVKSLLGPAYTLKEVSRTANEADTTLYMLFHHPQDGNLPVVLDSHARGSNDAMFSTLDRAKIHIPPANVGDFRAFMSTFLQELQLFQKFNRTVSQCGWDGDDFVLGLTTYRKGHPPVAAHSTQAPLLEEYKPAGDRSKWQQAFNVMLTSGADRQMMLALGIASPLMAFSGLHAAIVHMLSESGTGKTTTCKMVQSIWGNPKKLQMSVNDTEAALDSIAGVTGTMPFVLDEITQLDGKDSLKRVLTFTMGREKHRLDQNRKVGRNDAYWSFVVFCSSNTSMVTRLLGNDSTDSGGLARVSEISLSPLSASKEQLRANRAIVNEIEDHYGWLGPELAQLYADGGAAMWKDAVARLIIKWDRLLDEGTAGRFHAAVGALAELGARIGRDMLHLNFDVDEVCAEVMRQAKAQRTAVTEQRRDLYGFLSDYILDYENDMMWYRNGASGQRLPHSNGKCRGEKHEDTNAKVTRYVVRTADLMEYVVLKKGKWEILEKQLAKNPNITVTPMMYLKNSTQTPQRHKCLVIDFTAMSRPMQAVTTNTATGGP